MLCVLDIGVERAMVVVQHSEGSVLDSKEAVTGCLGVSDDGSSSRAVQFNIARNPILHHPWKTKRQLQHTEHKTTENYQHKGPMQAFNIVGAGHGRTWQLVSVSTSVASCIAVYGHTYSGHVDRVLSHRVMQWK